MKCWLYSFKKDCLSMAGSRCYTIPCWYLGKQDPFPIARVYHPGRTHGQIIIKPVRSATAVGSVQIRGICRREHAAVPVSAWGWLEGTSGKAPQRGFCLNWEMGGPVGWQAWMGQKVVWREAFRQREEGIDHKNKEIWKSVHVFRLGTSVMTWKINQRLITIRIWDSSLTMAVSGRQNCSFCSWNTVSVHKSQ